MQDVNDAEYKEYLKCLIKVEKKYDPDHIRLSSGYKVTGRFVFSDGKKEVCKTNEATAYVLKINGDWIWYANKDGMQYYAFECESGDSFDLYSFTLNTYINRTLRLYYTSDL